MNVMIPTIVERGHIRREPVEKRKGLSECRVVEEDRRRTNARRRNSERFRSFINSSIDLGQRMTAAYPPATHTHTHTHERTIRRLRELFSTRPWTDNVPEETRKLS